MNILKQINRIPGGMMVIPLLLGAIINTFSPEILNIGGFTTELFKNGTGTLIGLFLFCTGAGISFKSAAKAIKRGVCVSLSKIIIGALVGILVMKYFSGGMVFGLSALAIISAMTNGNGGLYAALTSEFGDKNDQGATGIIVMNSGPFITLLILGMSGSASVPILSIIGIITPIILGMILGNIDPDLGAFFSVGSTFVIPFFSFSIGASINLIMIVSGGIPGILLGLMTVVIGGFFNVKVDRMTGGSGISGASISSVAGNAVATPMAVAIVDPSLYELALKATPQIMAAMITTALLTPAFVAYISKQNLKKIKGSN